VRSGDYVVVGDQGALDGRVDEPVVPDRSVEGEEPLHDACPQPGGDPSAVAFEAEAEHDQQAPAQHELTGRLSWGWVAVVRIWPCGHRQLSRHKRRSVGPIRSR
jgi:hypothetical protein